MKKNPRILFVAFPFSVHSMRWINQLINSGWDVLLFPSQKSPLHEQFRNITYFSSDFIKPNNIDKTVKWKSWTSLAFYIDMILKKIFHIDTQYRFQKIFLKIIIKYYKPDIIHSLEMQHAGYLTNQVKKGMNRNFPKWILSIWGSDLFLFSRLEKHYSLIITTLQNLDYLLCECSRDDQLAINLGYKGKILPNIHSTGGLDFSTIQDCKKEETTSTRKSIILKGYQHWAGRALVGLVALSKCKDLLNEFDIIIHSATPDVEIAAELFSKDTHIRVKLIPQISIEEILSYYRKARIYIGLSISDGVPNSLLEAMATGVFPIQSSTAATGDWINHGETGFIVPPEDPEIIAECIKRALSDDLLVDRAAIINKKIIQKKLNAQQIREKVFDMYKEILSN